MASSVAENYGYGKLGIIGMRGCEEITAKINDFLTQWHTNDRQDREDYIIRTSCPRFGTGEGKGLIHQSVRGNDLYIICDIFNYGVTYRMYEIENHMSPDDHFQDLKRIISAVGGHCRRITVFMPMLYEGRQHRRSARESLDCALALQELHQMGVSAVITFDAHDPRVQNAVPLGGFENVHPTYQMIKALVNTTKDLIIDREHLMVIAPDEGGMSRCIYYSSVLGIDLGMFYKRRDYSVIVNGRNPIVSHEFLGDNVDGKDVIVVDDMIASGDSMLDIASKLRKMGARRVFVFATFGLFCDGLSRFDEAYSQGLVERVFSTNLVYRSPELKTRPWQCTVDMSKYIAYIIETLNRDMSISSLLNPVHRINNLLLSHGFTPHAQTDEEPSENGF